MFLLDNAGNTLTLFLQPYLSDVIGTSGTLLFYSLNCVFSFFLVDWLLPETQNLSLEEVQIKLARRAVMNRWWVDPAEEEEMVIFDPFYPE